MEDLMRVCREFRIGRLQEVEDLLGGGYINANMKIRTSKGRFVVRIFLKEVEKERLEYTYSIVSQLALVGLPALVPLRNRQGLSYTRYKEFVVQITPFVEASRFQYVPEQAYSSGKTLRRMHETLKMVKESPKPTGIYHYYQLDPAKMIKKLLSDGYTLPSHEGSLFDEFYNLLEPINLNTSNLPKTILHGDWNPSNQLYNKNNEVCSFMDFDTLQQGERIFDVAYALYFFLIQRRNERVTQEFLRGYGPLSQEEIHVLPFLIAKIGLYFGICVEYGEFRFDRNLEQLKWVITKKGRKTLRAFCIRDS